MLNSARWLFMMIAKRFYMPSYLHTGSSLPLLPISNFCFPILTFCPLSLYCSLFHRIGPCKNTVGFILYYNVEIRFLYLPPPPSHSTRSSFTHPLSIPPPPLFPSLSPPSPLPPPSLSLSLSLVRYFFEYSYILRTLPLVSFLFLCLFIYYPHFSYLIHLFVGFFL